MVAHFQDQQVLELSYFLGPAAITTISLLSLCYPSTLWGVCLATHQAQSLHKIKSKSLLDKPGPIYLPSLKL